MTLSRYVSEVEQGLSNYLESEKSFSAETKLFLTRIKQTTSIGKRFRPRLFFLMLSAYSTKTQPISIGVSLELLHEALLIHDDLIDQDLIRHGQLNINGLYKKDKNYQSTNIPESMSLLAGDLLLATLTEPILKDKKLSPQTKLDCISLFTDTVKTCIYGQQLDSLNSASKLKLDSKRLDYIYARKTAAYTCLLPTRLAACLGNVSKAEQCSLDNFANALGIYFQELNDQADYFLSRSLKDFSLGKITRVYLIAVDKLNSKDKKELTSYFIKPALTNVDKNHVLEILAKYKIPEDSEKVLLGLYQEVLAALNKLKISGKSKQNLLALVNSLKV